MEGASKNIMNVDINRGPSKTEDQLDFDEYLALTPSPTYKDRGSLAGHLIRYRWAIQNSHKENLGRVLDAGCGIGFGSAFMSPWADEVVGIDFNADIIQFASQTYMQPNLHFQVGDCTTLTFPDSSFDMIVSFELIEHIKDVNRYLSEMRRVLRITESSSEDSGIFFLSTPNAKNREISGKEMHPYHVKEYNSDELETLLKQHFNQVKLYLQIHRGENLTSLRRNPLLDILYKIAKETIPYRLRRRISERVISPNTLMNDWVVIEDLDGYGTLLAICRP